MIEVMDYLPATLYTVPTYYYDDLDAAIRKAAYKYVGGSK